MSKSVLSLSGGYFVRVTGTWAAFFALIVMLPTAPQKQRPGSGISGLQTFGASASSVPGVVLNTRGIDFSALPDTAFGDSDTTR